MDLVRVERGQLVLVAAAVIAIGLAPIVFAYLQLGYHPDLADTEPDVSSAEPVTFLDRSVHEAAMATAGDYDWRRRGAMAAAVRAEIDGDIETLETSSLEEGLVHEIEYNATTATAWGEENCERGEGRRFGPCETDGGVVLQDRAGDAVLLAVAFDVRSVGPDGEAEMTVVVEVGGGGGS